MDWFLYDRGLHHERVNKYIVKLCFLIQEIKLNILFKNLYLSLARSIKLVLTKIDQVETIMRYCRTNVQTTLKRCFAKSKRLLCVNVVQRCFDVVSTSDTDVVVRLRSIENPKSGFVSFSTSGQPHFHR